MPAPGAGASGGMAAVPSAGPDGRCEDANTAVLQQVVRELTMVIQRVQGAHEGRLRGIEIALAGIHKELRVRGATAPAAQLMRTSMLDIYKTETSEPSDEPVSPGVAPSADEWNEMTWPAQGIDASGAKDAWFSADIPAESGVGHASGASPFSALDISNPGASAAAMPKAAMLPASAAPEKSSETCECTGAAVERRASSPKHVARVKISALSAASEATTLRSVSEGTSDDISDVASEFSYADVFGQGRSLDFGTPTAAEIIGNFSTCAYWTLFFGGFAVFRNPYLQAAYLAVFLICFLSCAVGCTYNVVVRTPPYSAFAIDVVTAYFHVVALHTWISWRRYMWDPNLVELLQLARDAVRKQQWPKEVTKSLVRHIKWFARGLLVLQVVTVLWGYAVLPMPAMSYAMRDSGDALPAARAFAMIHAVQMYVAIPGHVPTLLAGYGFLFFVCRIHSLDARRLESMIAGKHRTRALRQFRTDEDILPLANECGELIHKAQMRLTASCSSWGFLMVHQLVYILCQIVSVFLELTSDFVASRVVEYDDHILHRSAYAAWHFAIALVGLVCLLFIPASTTSTFEKSIRSVYTGLRSRGASERLAVQMAADTSFHIEGCTLLATQVSFKSVGVFLSVAATCFTFLIEMRV